MEFRDKLLSGEIRHVSEMVNMLSYELIILQDFLKTEFGARYSRFRRRHALATESVLLEHHRVGHDQGLRTARHGLNQTTPVGSKVARPGSRAAQSNSSDHEKNATVSTPVATTDILIENEPAEADLQDEVSQLTATEKIEDVAQTFIDENDDEMEDNESVSSSDESSANDKTWLSGSQEQRRGRYRLDIWNKFHTKVLPNGKKTVSCRKCSLNVSAVPKRMEKHYRNCCRDLPITKSNRDREQFSRSRTSLPRGHVWSHFNQETTSDGKIIVRCKYCSSKVSNHATRMARHLQACEMSPVFGASTTHSETNDNNDINDDTSFHEKQDIM